MTLVAGFRAFGCPILLGDFLLTSPQGHGVRKKIVRVAPNFAVAWTGHLAAADSVVRCLQDGLACGTVDMSAVERILITPSTAELGSLSVVLVGWVADATGEHSFRWRSDYPHEVFRVDPVFEGSGQQTAASLIGSGRAGQLNASDPVAVSGLDVATRLMATELVDESYSDLGFGFAYELLAMNPHRTFEYVDEVLYFAVTHEFDAGGRHQKSAFLGRIFKYWTVNEFSFWRMIDPTSPEDQELHIVTPIGRYDSYEADRLLRHCAAQKEFPFSSDHYVSFFHLQAPGFASPLLVANLHDDRSGEGAPIAVTGDSLHLALDRGVLEHTYRIVRADMMSSSVRQGHQPDSRPVD